MPRANPKLARARADVLVREFVDRVAAVNASEDYAFTITTVVVFGSYLTDAPKIGDLDLAIATMRRSMDDAEQEALEQRAYDAPSRPRQFRNLMHELIWPREFVLRALKNRVRAISIHSIDDLEAFYRDGVPVPYCVVAGTWTPAPPQAYRTLKQETR